MNKTHIIWDRQYRDQITKRLKEEQALIQELGITRQQWDNLCHLCGYCCRYYGYCRHLGYFEGHYCCTIFNNRIGRTIGKLKSGGHIYCVPISMCERSPNCPYNQFFSKPKAEK